MNTQHGGTRAVTGRASRPYRLLSTEDVVRRIVDHSDPVALEELHDHRALCRTDGGTPVRIAEYLAELRSARRGTGVSEQVLDRAYDLAIDKFSHLPDGNGGNGRAGRPEVDCRNYFRNVVSFMARFRQLKPGLSPVEYETATMYGLQSELTRQFHLSCREALRSCNPARTRYIWHVNGSAISVWIPARVPGRERRAWLEANIPDFDPRRPGERERVQDITDRLLGAPRHVRLPRKPSRRARRSLAIPAATPSIEKEITTRGLAAAVADEKAENLHNQRASIRELGGARLKELILRIFTELSEECYDEKRLAQAFGLSRATVSRFAGSLWNQSTSGNVPDLWLNVAQTLSNHRTFTAAAQEAGVWEQVRTVLARDTSRLEETR